MMNRCNCSCHWMYSILYVLGSAAAILFIWTSLASTDVLGKMAVDYFMWAVILLLLSKTGKICRRCGHAQGMMQGNASNMCTHGVGCKCGDCDRCR